MEPSQFLSALLAIIVIDLVLAGDNAIVIALAARGLPAHLQKRAILWGAFGAIFVRSLMTVVVVWLLKVPGLLAAGGIMLVWIAYTLLRPNQADGQKHGAAAVTFAGAIRTIVVADAVMGLDNVLAVAGAAHGSYLLVVTGLVISVPIVVWGSSVVLKLVDRFPALVYFGAAVLLWTAVKMVLTEPLLRPWWGAAPMAQAVVYMIIPLVLLLGIARNHPGLESRIRTRVADWSARFAPKRHTTPIGVVAKVPTEGDETMLKVLVPTDGSANSLRAVRHVVAEYRRDPALEVHLLNVQPRLSRHIARFVARRDRHAWHGARAQAAMVEATAALDEAGVPHQAHWALGERASEICRTATRIGAHHIVIGAARSHSVARLLQEPVIDRLLKITTVPVKLVAGEGVSRWQRWGLPVGILGVGGLMLLALE